MTYLRNYRSGEFGYLCLLNDILNEGCERTDRTGTGTLSLFGESLTFDCTNSFPILTTKKVNFKAVLSELLWFLEGSTDERRLAEIHYERPRSELNNKRTIWTDNAEAEYWKENAEYPGDLGNVYGKMWRKFPGRLMYDEGCQESNPTYTRLDYLDSQSSIWNEEIDQINNLIEGIKKDPFGRRHIVSAWNPGLQTSDQVALPPCHIMFQIYVDDQKRMSLQMYQRSGDVFLGIPFNISSYAILLHIICKLTNFKPYKLKMVFGDVHIYKNHVDSVKLQLSKNIITCNPQLQIKNIESVDNLHMNDFELLNYESHPFIKADMAV